MPLGPVLKPGAAEGLRERFHVATPKRFRTADRYDLGKLAATCAVAVIAGFGTPLLIERLSPWPAGTTVRHVLSAPNCDTARLLGLAPALRGNPGYWPQHDRDGDGIACEPGRKSWSRPAWVR